MSTSVKLEVSGTPAPQGSKTYIGNGRMIEASKKVTPWRTAIIAEHLSHDRTPPIEGAVWVDVVFYMQRPKKHMRSGKFAGEVSWSAPKHHTTYPDVDKLVRSTLDGLAMAGVFLNDSQVVAVTARKAFADGRETGATIRVASLC